MKPPGFFERLFGRFKFNLTVNTSPGQVGKSSFHVKTTVHRSQTIKIRDAATGETKEYHSLEEVPEKYREQMREAMSQGRVSKSEQVTFVGLDGVRHTYQSMDEVPASIRKLIADAGQSTDIK